ncbi:lipase [Rhodococcus sp. 05-2255-3B1]|uniref:alpha/beta hydrolase family protein n=1 Tax=unclassified Rhodococcus (in: high G+C Gram-positive bacteria) TaxID=192944 RepID=UPI000B9C08F9|nr:MULTISPECIES: lipase family protein [unclassified Rhodococcus (in: high G+C Gram-positive bacteria)]OZE02541.1 lipase [Rhodococcus sp. 05-2255-3C]OZE11392.1 lipase [Rhodococcus sp. 05-2255-3B1]OZE13118.1 lipase [Rhodococcus sp. 05-2255-2A2]
MPGRFAAQVGVVLTAAAVLVSCSQQPSVVLPPNAPTAPVTAEAPASEPPPPSNVGGTAPGSLISAEPIEDIATDITELGATATRVVYRSTSGVTGSPTEVSGTVIVPAGTAPEGGWPIVSFGHGTTGVLNACGPSLYANLLGNAPIVAALALNGFAVAMTDYQGLGMDGDYHPYLDSKTFGYNMIDAVRAARNFMPTLSTRWAAYGVSLGGMAAWAASDRNGEYGGGLELVGTAAMVPVSDMSGLADAAANETLTRAQYPLLMYALHSLAISHPEMNLDDYRSGFAKERWDDLLECVPPGSLDVPELQTQLEPADLKPVSAEATDRLRGYLSDMALPQQGSTTPLLVMYGSQDDLILEPWTEKALQRACDSGDLVEYELHQGEGHGNLDSSRSLPWVKGMFAGQRPVNTCELNK